MLVHPSRIHRRIARAHSRISPWRGLRLCGLRHSSLGMMGWLDRVPLVLLVAVALWLAVAPIVPEPHLVEKLRMLSQGMLTRPLDLFDLALHAAPMLLLAIRLWRMRRRK